MSCIKEEFWLEPVEPVLSNQSGAIPPTLDLTSSVSFPNTVSNELRVGASKCMQISIVTDTYEPSEGWLYWNPKGFMCITKETAIALGTNSEPANHVHGEIQRPCLA